MIFLQLWFTPYLDYHNDGALEQHQGRGPQDVDDDADGHVRRERFHPLLRGDSDRLHARGRADRARVIIAGHVFDVESVGEVKRRGSFSEIGHLGTLLQNLHLADFCERRRAFGFAAAIDFLKSP